MACFKICDAPLNVDYGMLHVVPAALQSADFCQQLLHFVHVCFWVGHTNRFHFALPFALLCEPCLMVLASHAAASRVLLCCTLSAHVY